MSQWTNMCNKHFKVTIYLSLSIFPNTIGRHAFTCKTMHVFLHPESQAPVPSAPLGAVAPLQHEGRLNLQVLGREITHPWYKK